MRPLGRTSGFALAAYAFWLTMLGTTLPTPLYPLFQRRYSFGELLVTVVFAIYAFGVIAGLILFGNLSDQFGRKPLLAAGLGFSALSAVLFLVAGSLVPIYAARVISGLSAGIYTGTATAFLLDLAPNERRRQTSLIAVVVNLGGLGSGTLLSGLLAQYGGHPLRLPFAVDLVLLVPATVGLLLTPETVTRGDARLRLQRLGVPAQVRGVFVRGATVSFAAFAVAGVFGAVGPAFLGTVLGRHSPALAGLLVFVLFGMSLGGQLLLRRLSEQHALTTGCSLLLCGVGLLALAVGLESLAALFASAVVAGLGQGVVMGSALAAINARAPEERRSETASSYFVVIYVGLSVPVIAAGIAIAQTSLRTAAYAFCAVVAVLVAAVLATQAHAE